MSYAYSVLRAAKGLRELDEFEKSVLKEFDSGSIATLIDKRWHWNGERSCSDGECRVINACVRADILKIDYEGVCSRNTDWVWRPK